MPALDEAAEQEAASTTGRGDSAAASSAAPPAAASLAGLSYSEQYDVLFQTVPVNAKKVVPKPSNEEQAKQQGAKRVMLSDVWAVQKKPLWFGREWTTTDKCYLAFIGAMHAVAACAFSTFSWPMVQLFAVTYFVTGCLGITLSYHRQLSHRSFATPKWLEYVLAYCGVLAAQGDPTEWVSCHRYHHLHCETPKDPHSPYEGFWWSHAGWLLDNKTTMDRIGDKSNTPEMDSQWFYPFLQKTYALHVVGMFAALYAFGGFPAVVWGGALRIVWVYHITWAVNSASHVWGYQSYKTGDQSRNNWWVGLLAWGEGWHNNHHAFEWSARHGLEWWQFDTTWIIIRSLQALGLAHNVKLPTEKQKAKLAFDQ